MKAIKKNDVVAAAIVMPEVDGNPRWVREGRRVRKAVSVALDNGNPEIVRLMLDSGKTCFRGTHMLHEAVRMNQWDMMGFIVAQGVSPEDATFELALQETEQLGHFKTLLSNSEPRSSGKFLLKALEYEKTELFELLLEWGADVNYQEASSLLKIEVFSNGYSLELKPDPRGMNALGLAVSQGKIGITRSLLEKGANPNVSVISLSTDRLPFSLSTDRLPFMGEDRASLDSALRRGNYVTFDLGGGQQIIYGDTKNTYLGFGSLNPELLSIQGNQLSTPLILAVISERSQPSKKMSVIRLLLNHGVDTNVPDERGLTALMHAEERGLTDIQDLLKTSR